MEEADRFLPHARPWPSVLAPRQHPNCARSKTGGDEILGITLDLQGLEFALLAAEHDVTNTGLSNSCCMATLRRLASGWRRCPMTDGTRGWPRCPTQPTSFGRPERTTQDTAPASNLQLLGIARHGLPVSAPRCRRRVAPGLTESV
jgi:hypothetical protein